MSENVMQKKSISLPCHKYMVRHIKNEADKLEYAHAFFQKMNEQETNIDEIISSYMATSLFQEDTDLDFLSYQGIALTGEQFYHSIMEDCSISVYKKCQAYIRKYEKDIVPVCKVCPHCPQYANKNRSNELSIIKRINASYNSLQVFLSRSNGSYFKSCNDIAQNTPSPVPLVIPFLRIFFNIIKSYGAGYYEQRILELSDQQRLAMLQNRMYAELKAKYKIDVLIPNSVRIFPLLYTSWVEEIEQAADISDQDIEAYVLPSKKKSSKTIVKNMPKKDGKPSSEYAVEKQEEKSLPPKAATIKEGDSHDDELQYAFSLTDIIAEPVTDTKLSRSFTDLSLFLSEIDLSKSEEAIEDTHNNSIDVENNTRYIDNKLDTETDIPCASTSTHESESVTNLSVKKEFIVVESIPYDYIPLPCIDRTRLAEHIIQVSDNNIDLLTHAIERDRDLPLECIIDETGLYAAILWIRPIRQFFYSYFTDLHVRIKELLTSRRIKKICYQPYYLYSLCRLYNIQIKHVYAFHSIHMHILKTDHKLGYREIIKLYGEGKNCGHTIDTVPELEEIMTGIPLYRTINRVQTKLISANENYSSQAARVQNLDEVLGTSFLRSINFNDDSTLMFIRNGQICFNHCLKNNAKSGGFILTYMIENEEIDNTTKQKIFLDLLCDLSKKGRIRKLNLQLMTMYDDIMILFVADESYEFLTTYIHIHLYGIAQSYGCDDFRVVTTHERCIPKINPY